ncbi:hypothetical protein [Mesonia aquimarina]|uniref:hypothetical protein n=1 Tax=Mesonia aquimarina TaxID=1504967 RepID=UPI000EF56A16|nr:hypothetical protein [Mesonia aquimarina]
MKKFKNLIILTLLVSLCACSNNEEEAKQDNFDLTAASFSVFEENTIGVFDDNNEFHEITPQQLEDFYQKVLEEESLSIDEITIEETLDNNDELLYYLLVENEEGGIRISSDLNKIGPSSFSLKEGLCTCKTFDCRETGCKLKKAGDSCFCTSCEGTCTKYSIQIPEPNLHLYFNLRAN